jgi:hypothetical protein
LGYGGSASRLYYKRYTNDSAELDNLRSLQQDRVTRQARAAVSNPPKHSNIAKPPKPTRQQTLFDLQAKQKSDPMVEKWLRGSTLATADNILSASHSSPSSSGSSFTSSFASSSSACASSTSADLANLKKPVHRGRKKITQKKRPRTPSPSPKKKQQGSPLPAINLSDEDEEEPSSLPNKKGSKVGGSNDGFLCELDLPFLHSCARALVRC